MSECSWSHAYSDRELKDADDLTASLNLSVSVHYSGRHKVSQKSQTITIRT